MTSGSSLPEELRKEAAEAVRLATIIVEPGTRAVLRKMAADLLATAAEFEAATTLVVAPEPIEEIRPAQSPKSGT